MNHRHIDTAEWSLAAIDSALERGDLDDWRELFRAAKADRTVALKIRKIAAARPEESSSPLALALVERVLSTASRVTETGKPA